MAHHSPNAGSKTSKSDLDTSGHLDHHDDDEHAPIAPSHAPVTPHGFDHPPTPSTTPLLPNQHDDSSHNNENDHHPQTPEGPSPGHTQITPQSHDRLPIPDVKPHPPTNDDLHNHHHDAPPNPKPHDDSDNHHHHPDGHHGSKPSQSVPDPPSRHLGDNHIPAPNNPPSDPMPSPTVTYSTSISLNVPDGISTPNVSKTPTPTPKLTNPTAIASKLKDIINNIVEPDPNTNWPPLNSSPTTIQPDAPDKVAATDQPNPSSILPASGSGVIIPQISQVSVSSSSVPSSITGTSSTVSGSFHFPSGSNTDAPDSPATPFQWSTPAASPSSHSSNPNASPLPQSLSSVNSSQMTMMVSAVLVPCALIVTVVVVLLRCYIPRRYQSYGWKGFRRLKPVPYDDDMQFLTRPLDKEAAVVEAREEEEPVQPAPRRQSRFSSVLNIARSRWTMTSSGHTGSSTLHSNSHESESLTLVDGHGKPVSAKAKTHRRVPSGPRPRS